MELISILMATDRISVYLDLSVDSILNQSYRNFEFIIVCNGPSCKIVSQHLKERFNDSRIVLLETPIRQLGFSMNYALTFSKADIIARMDADDISNSNRLEIQYKYLVEKNLDLLGSFLELINEEGVTIGYRKYPCGNKINRNILRTNPFAHNTILCRKSVLLNHRGYAGGFNTEDYDLWLRMRKSELKWENLQLYLVKYRIHENSSQKKRLSYSEAGGHIFREFLLTPTIALFFYSILAVCKTLILSKK